MEESFELARKFRILFFIIIVIAFAVKAYAFWPPDLVPHPHIPEPEVTHYPDDHLSKR